MLRLLLPALLALSAGALSAAAPPVARRDLYGDPLPAGAIARLGSVRYRHLWATDGGLAISRDGSLLASYGDDIRIWERATGRPLVALPPPVDLTHSIAFTPDGKGLVTGHGSEADEVWIWDWRAGTRRALWGDGRSRGTPRHLAFSKDGKSLAVLCQSPRGDDPAVLSVHDFPSGERRSETELDIRPDPAGLAFDPLGRLALAAEGVHLIDPRLRREVGRLGPKGGISSFALSPDGKTAAVLVRRAGPDPKEEGYVELVSLTTGRVTRTAVGGPARSRLAFSADGKELYFASRESSVVVLGPADGKVKCTAVPSDGVWRPWMTFSEDGRFLAWTSGQVISTWDLREGKQAPTPEDHRVKTGFLVFALGLGCIDIAVSPDGERVASRSSSEVRVWELATGRMLRCIRGEGLLRGVGWSPDGRQVGVGSPGRFTWYDARTGAKTRGIPLPAKQPVAEVRATADGKRVILHEGRGRIDYPALIILNAADGKELARFRNTDGEYFLGTSEYASLLLSRHHSKGAAALRVRTLTGRGHLFETPPGGGGAEARLFNGGRVLAAWPSDGVKAWDVRRGWRLGPAVPRRAVGFHARVLAASPDGRTLAVVRPNVTDPAWGKSTRQVTASCRVHLVETASGRVRATLPLLPRVIDAFFTRDGRRLVTAGEDATALVWDLDELAPPARLVDAWGGLADPDAGKAFAAIRALGRARGAASLLRERLTPERVDADRVRAWLDDLDAESFDARIEAERRLRALGSAVEGDIIRALKKDPPLEPRGRLQRLLQQAEADLEALRQGRAVEALERMKTSEAARLLRELAAGYAGARQTREAKEAFARIAGGRARACPLHKSRRGATITHAHERTRRWPSRAASTVTSSSPKTRPPARPAPPAPPPSPSRRPRRRPLPRRSRPAPGA